MKPGDFNIILEYASLLPGYVRIKNSLEGGGFQDGFLSGAVSEAVPINKIGPVVGKNGAINYNIIAERTAAAAVVGGTVASATGGNFVDGARTGAYGELYNDVSAAMIGTMCSSNKEQREESLKLQKALNKNPKPFWTVGSLGLWWVPGYDDLELANLAEMTEVAESATEARSAINGLNLQKSLASAEQMGQEGHIFAGADSGTEFRDAARVADQYGGNAGDWVKKASTQFISKDGTSFNTHWVENIRTGERVEYKTKLFP